MLVYLQISLLKSFVPINGNLLGLSPLPKKNRQFKIWRNILVWIAPKFYQQGLPSNEFTAATSTQQLRQNVDNSFSVYQVFGQSGETKTFQFQKLWSPRLTRLWKSRASTWKTNEKILTTFTPPDLNNLHIIPLLSTLNVHKFLFPLNNKSPRDLVV